MGQEEVVFSWERVVKATAAAPEEARGDVRPPGSPKKAPLQQPPARRLSVPPPPGRASSAPAPATRTLSSSRARAVVRSEDDPFLAAYLACTKSSGRRGGGKDAGGGAPRGEAEAKGRRRLFTWAGLGLSCKSSAGAVEQSMVKMTKRPEPDPTGDA